MTEHAGWGWRYGFRLALGVVFLWAALAKIGDIPGFAGEIHNYRILPRQLENLLAITLPWIEVLAGLALVLNLAPRAATWVLGGLLVVFFAGILSAIARDLDIACGCFGTSDATRTGWFALLRDIVFMAFAWAGYPRGPSVPRTAADLRTA